MRAIQWFTVVAALSLLFASADMERRSRDVEANDENIDVSQLVVQPPTLVSQLTGAGSPARTDEPWNIYGTDLGLIIEHDGKIYAVFGDTWGREANEGADWRSNTMAIIEPHAEHGYVITDVIKGDNGEAKELLPSLKEPGKEYTVIPTSGIAVDDRMYLHYMSIRDWEEQWWGYKQPVTNGAGLAYSDDDGQTWVKDPTAWWPGETGFTQTAMVADGDHIYMFGTPAGRFGPLKLLRVPESRLLDSQRYEYWTGAGWSDDAGRAVEVLPAPVGELSVRWSEHHQRWLMMYTNEVSHSIVLRTAERLEGPWDEERVVATAEDYPTLYGSFMLPIEGPDVYFTMSIFEHYQVFVMRLTL